MVNIIFISHSTTTDNEQKLASGHYDVELSPLGEQQAQEVGERFKDTKLDAVFCSDLQRSYRTAEIAFGDKFPIIKDERLRECNYGKLNRHDKAVVDGMKGERIDSPYPEGESFTDTTAKMKSFLHDLLRDYDGKTVMIIGHRATQYGLDTLLNNIPLKDAVTAPWSWQPMWEYTLNELS